MINNSAERPSHATRRRYDRDDYILGAFLASLTLGAVVFPWHAYNYPSQYNRPLMAFSADPGRLNLNVLAEIDTTFDLRSGQFVANYIDDGVDAISTAGVSREEQTKLVSQSPTVISARFSLIAADERRALVESADGIYLVRPYSRLPDGSKVRVLNTGNGGAELITTRFEIIK